MNENKNIEKQAVETKKIVNETKVIEFTVGDTLYGVEISKVREIIRTNIDIVAVPDAHSSIDGAINLRGIIIPVINLARHMRTEEKIDQNSNRIIVTEFVNATVGFLVGSVAEIHTVETNKIEKSSAMIQTDEEYVSGIVKIENKVLFLLDFGKVAKGINPRIQIS